MDCGSKSGRNDPAVKTSCPSARRGRVAEPCLAAHSHFPEYRSDTVAPIPPIESPTVSRSGAPARPRLRPIRARVTRATASVLRRWVLPATGKSGSACAGRRHRRRPLVASFGSSSAATSKRSACSADLRRAGVEISREQERFALAGGWLRGKVDAVGVGFLEAPKAEHVIEIKSMKAADWRAVQKHGVAKAKPEHWHQLHVGMAALGIARGAYIAD